MRHPQYIQFFPISLLTAAFAQFEVFTDRPVSLEERNQPSPDVCVARGELKDYLERHPRPEDLLLVVEVADSSLGFDLGAKAAAYARAGVPTYWVLDVQGRALHVHEEASSDGSWQSIRVLSGLDNTGLPNVTVNDLTLP
ncbi:Uma2 family endonuclease [Gloeobacter morelensis MG652769]|uniref:Uma2 family endonuclease n=1 Tax=Gloeobacter morelensis MG652769 TaxID=2781736 RepID=A0ABY3PNK9_9CYAN|nr:Uma2 family endonuclease [Gloeobacter morelensis]UFP95226.1 Uma2 family endonuclease [Gloeobacter morelensis MG652769]